MTDVTFSIAASADDGACDVGGGGFSSSESAVDFGSSNVGGAQHCYFWYDNINIPAGAIIDSAVLRCRSAGTTSGTTVNVTLHFEQADDPIPPTTDSDLLGRSLDAGIDWDNLPAWTYGVNYDSPELSAPLQVIVNRGGWNSGQAVQVHVVDNGSDSTIERRVCTKDHFAYTGPDLVVSYHLFGEIEVSESITATESVSIESDLITQEQVSVTEYSSLLLGFDESLPTITQDITLTESVTMIRGLAGLPEQFESINLSESITALLGFDESLPEQIESISLSEYSLVDISPGISVFESITLWESGNIRPEPFASDDIDLSEYVLARRGYWADVDDSFTITDVFRVFHYSNWLRQNKAQSKQRFFFTLTGATDETTDAEIPASAIFARKRSGDPTYLQVTIPTFNYSVDVALRSGGEMLVDMAYEIDGEIALRERILEADLEDISTYEGPVSRSIVLTGHRTQSFGGQVVTFNRSEVIYRG